MYSLFHEFSYVPARLLTLVAIVVLHCRLGLAAVSLEELTDLEPLVRFARIWWLNWRRASQQGDDLHKPPLRMMGIYVITLLQIGFYCPGLIVQVQRSSH